MTDDPHTAGLSRVECPAEREPAVKLYIIAGLFLALGVYCLVDVQRGAYTYTPFSVQNINAWASWAFNYGGQFVFCLAGLAMAVLATRSLRRVLVADEKGIGYVGGRAIAWEHVEQIDASKLAAKKILTLRAAGNGKLVLDQYKLQNFRDLVAFIEQQVPAEKQTL